MVEFFTAFLAVFFSGQQASILFGFSSSEFNRKTINVGLIANMQPLSRHD